MFFLAPELARINLAHKQILSAEGKDVYVPNAETFVFINCKTSPVQLG